ncbi:MAG: SRPBCC domain-containing protein [bacterium]
MSDSKSKPNTRSVEAEIEIDAPLAAVWKALTDADELTRWFPLEAGKNPDGTLWMSWRNEFKWDSRIEIADPPRHFRYVTIESLSGEQPASESEDSNTKRMEPTATDFYLEARGGKTVLRLVHSGFSTAADWDALYDGTKRGWKFQLWSLRHYLENHRGTPRHHAYVRVFLKKLTLEQGWQRLFGPEMLVHEGGVENLKQGDRYTLRTAAGDVFSGAVFTCDPPREFSATVENFNNGILEVHADALFDYRDANFYLFTYGIPQRQLEDIESRTRRLLEKLEV